MLQITEDYGYTSVIIGACNERCALLCADSRMVTVDGGEQKNIDDCRKVFKVNNRLLFGATGMFPIQSRIIEPLVGLDCLSLNVDSAVRAVNDYILAQMANGTIRDCIYILAGEDEDGKICIASVRYDEKKDAVYFGRQYADQKDCIYLALPPSASWNDEWWRERLTQRVTSEINLPLEAKLSSFIKELSIASSFVGGETVCRMIVAEDEKTPVD